MNASDTTSTPDTTGPAATPFSTLIRTASHEAHTEAETSTFMSDLLGGRLGVEAYARYTEQLWFVYEALEAETERLAADGAYVLVSGRRRDLGEKVVAGILERGGRAEFLPADLATGDGVTALADAATALALTALNDRPGGSISPFCEPETVTSTPHSSWR